MLGRMSFAMISAGLSLGAYAQEVAPLPVQGCTQTVGPLEFTNLVEVAVNGTLTGVEEADSQIARAFASLECLGEQVSESDLGALYFAKGINAFYLGNRAQSHTSLTQAYAIGGWGVLDERYWDGVLVPFDRAAAQLMPKGVLDLSFLEPPSEVFLNGASVTSFGTRLISVMPYLLQWRDSSGWHNQIVEVIQGAETIAGGGSGTSPDSEEQVSESLFVATETVRRSPPAGRYSVGLVYSLGIAHFGHETGGVSGGAVAPGLVLSGDVVLADRLYLSSTARLGAPSSIPDFSSGVDFVVGGTQQLPFFEWGAGVGPILVPMTTLVDGEILTTGNDVTFDSAWGVGVGLRAFVEYGDFRGGVGFQWVEDRKGLVGNIEYLFPDIESVDAQPFARVNIESTSRETEFLQRDSFSVYVIESGLLWLF